MFWFAVGAIGLAALGSKIGAQEQAAAQKFQLQQQAMQNKFKAEQAEMNAKLLNVDRTVNAYAQEQATLNVALQDAYNMASTRVSHASSGILMNSASKYEQRASQEFMHKANLTNANYNLSLFRANADMQVANLKASRLMSLANAEANTILANSIDPNRVGWQSALLGGAQTGLTLAAAGAFDNAFGGAVQEAAGMGGSMNYMQPGLAYVGG